MTGFFPGRSPADPGLAVFLTAGAEPLAALAELVAVLDERGVDVLELGVPFPDSVTDGPVLRRCADRALARGTGLDEVLAFVAQVRPARLRIALLADWSHSLRGRPLPDAVGEIAASGVDGLLVHALPPRLADPYHQATADAGLPVVTTCYPGSAPEVRAGAAARAGAYLYLVAHYGRSGTAPAAGYADLAGTVAELRATCPAPIAVGFGVRGRADVTAIGDCGADAVIVGSAAVARVEHAQMSGHDEVAELHEFVSSLSTPSPLRSPS